MPWHRPLSQLLCLSLVVVAFSVAHADEPKPTISVSGSAQIRVVPDQAVLTAAVESRAKEVSAACRANQESIRSIVEFLKSSGVEDKHISTEYISIEPIMRRPGFNGGKAKQQALQQANQQAEDPFGEPDGEELEQPAGYLASRQFAITLTDLAKFDHIYCGLIERGINRVSGVEFRTTELRKYRDEARLQAVRAAKEKAQAMAGELGATISAIKSIGERREAFGRAAMQNVSADPFGANPLGAGASSEDSAAGLIRVIAEVDVVFYLGSAAMDD